MKKHKSVSLLQIASLVHSANNVIKVAIALLPQSDTGEMKISLVRINRRLDKALDSISTQAINTQYSNVNPTQKGDGKPLL